MITFDHIAKANESIKTTAIERKDKETGKITSKEYAEVNQRIKAFRMVYPEGCIYTEMISNQDGVCIFRATVSSNGDRTVNNILATGTAYEKENSTFINKTSYIENCETSAVGRALGMCGFGIDTSVASAEEVQNAIANQDKPERKATAKQIEVLSKYYTGANLKKLLETNDIKQIEDISMEVASKIIAKLKERETK